MFLQDRRSLPERAETPSINFQITEREKYLLQTMIQVLAHELMRIDAFTKNIEDAEQAVVKRLSQEIERYTIVVPQ